MFLHISKHGFEYIFLSSTFFVFVKPNKRQILSYFKNLKTQLNQAVIHLSLGKKSLMNIWTFILKVIEDAEAILIPSSHRSLFRESLLSVSSKSGNCLSFFFCLFVEVVVHCLMLNKRVVGMVINKIVKSCFCKNLVPLFEYFTSPIDVSK